VSCEYAQEATLDNQGRTRGGNGNLDSGIYGTGVSVQTMKMMGRDAEYNIPTVLRDNGYYTGLVGKWHMMPNDDMGHPSFGCADLESQPNEDKYNQCKDLLKDVGFNSIGGWYYGNIKNNQYFSHNPEWMVKESADFIETAIGQDKPFFLYFASTLTHTPFVAGNNGALAKFDPVDTPAGKLAGAAKDPKGKTSMLERDEVLAQATNISTTLGLDLEMAAKIYWADMQFGALIDVMKRFAVYDNTYVVFQSDHGQVAKGLMYEQGSRILNFQRYPKIWPKEQGPMILPDDFVTSNVDLAAAIFQVTEATVPAEYQLDGEPFVTDVTEAINDPDFDQVRDGHSSCRFKFMDAQNSYSMISGEYQYFYRASSSVDTMNDVDHLYADVNDEEQLYDLREDPSEQNNLFELHEEMDKPSRQEVIAEFQTIMREYIDIHCIATDGAQCLKPDPIYGLSNQGYFDIECEGSGDNSVGCPVHDNEVCEAGKCVERMDGLLIPTKRPSFAPTQRPTTEPTEGPSTSEPSFAPTQRPTPPPTKATPPPTTRPAPSPPAQSPPAHSPPAASPPAASPPAASPPAKSTRGRTSSRGGRTGGSTGGATRGGGGRGGRGRGSAMLFDGALSMDSDSALSLKDATVKVSTLAALFVVALAVWLLKWCMASKKQRERTTYPEAFDMGY